MPLPKRKTNFSVYTQKELLERRQELLDRITKSDTYLPDSVLHDDLDLGMLEFVKNNLQIVSDGKKVPIIDKIMTIQRWAEYTNNWEFSDKDGNVQVPFMAVIRKPEVQLGTNPSVQRTIPVRKQFHYATVPTWDGNQFGADIYKIPQPIAVDISYEVTIVCNKFRDLNKLNKLVMQNFSSRQAYTSVKGHYIPIVLDSIDDNTPMDTLDGRRFYLQNYKFTMLGFLIDSEEFEVKPAISRMFIMQEFEELPKIVKTSVQNIDEIFVTSIVADGIQTSFSVGETIAILVSVSINGVVQIKDVDYYHIAKTSKITFVSPPLVGSKITIIYYKGKNPTPTDLWGNKIFLAKETFIYDGTTNVFTTSNTIAALIMLDINGLIEENSVGYDVTNKNEITLLINPIVNSKITVTYFY
jgi:hypothetical protein